MEFGEEVGPFTIEGELGSGAMGTVYKARFRRDDGRVVPVALKVVALGLVGNDGAMARFEREADILKQLRHPHIVRLLARGRYKKTPFIAMEFVAGESLERALARRGRVDWEEVVAYGKQLCQALQHAHDRGIVHRDLKPSNLMVTAGGVLKLTDFGIAKDTDLTALTGANSTIGTAAYMSPEQCKGDRNLGPKSDLYSLGVVFYELLTGKKPFAADNTVELFLKHVNEKPVRPRKLAPDVPVWLDNLVMFLLEKDKDRRPLSAAKVGELLEEIEEKVASQQSVGAEVANARRVDRPAAAGPLDAADRSAARSLRAPGKKRKKKPAGGRLPGWAKAALIAVPLAGVTGFLAYQVAGNPLKPATLDDDYERLTAAGSPGRKLEAAADFLAAWGGAADPKVEAARALYKELKVRQAEETLSKRVGSRFERNAGEFDEETYQLAVQAVAAERAGDLAKAAGLWASARDKAPKLDLAGRPADDQVTKAVLGWVADRHARLIGKGVPEALDKVRKEIADAQRYEVDPKPDPNGPEGRAVRAVRLEQFGDPAKARAAWDELAALTDRDFDNKVWYLAAAQRLARLPPAKGKDDEVRAARAAKLAGTVAGLEAAWARVKDDPEKRRERSDVRAGLREVVALYADEPDEQVKGIVAKAEKMLQAAPKA